MLCFLERQGYVTDSGAEPQPMAQPAMAVNVEHVHTLTATGNGIITYRANLGDRLSKGDHLGDIVPLDSEGCEREPVYAPAEGLLFGRTQSHLVYPGAHLGMLACPTPQRAPGQQLSFR